MILPVSLVLLKIFIDIFILILYYYICKEVEHIKDEYSDHLLIFDSDDYNDDEDWEIVIKCLKEHLTNFKVLYADGNCINLRWDDKKGGQ